MNSLQTLIDSFDSRNARKIATIILSAALISGFFVSVALAAVSTLTVDSPVAGDEWRGSQEIVWSFTGGAPGDTVNIVYSTDDFSSQAVIALDVAYDSSPFIWDTTAFPDSANFKVRFIDDSSFVYDTSDAFMVDNADPATTMTPSDVPDGLDDWYVTIPTINLACDDGVIGSGCLAGGTQYRWDGGAWTEFIFDISPAEGTHTLDWYSEDNAVDALGAHNVEDVQSATFKVDTTDPTVSVTSSTPDGAYNAGNNISITLTFSENVTSTDSTTVTLDTTGTCIVGILSDTDTATCTYTVGAGENSGDLSVTNIAPDGGSIIDVAGNTADLSIVSNLDDTSDIVIDTTAPAAFTVGTVVTTGGTVIGGWWNGTNTGVDVDVPVANDVSLTGGTIQLQAEADGVFENIGDPYAILIGDLGTDVTISLTAAELEALADFGDGDNITFQAIITDIATNATTGGVSASDLDVDQEAPVVDAGTDKEVNAAATQDATASDGGGSNIATYAWTSHANVNFSSDNTEDTDVDASTDGTYTLTLTVNDNAGNSTADTATFVWDITDPILTEVTPVPSPTNNTSPSYTFNVDKAAWLVGNAGTINITGSCGAWDLVAVQDGDNTVTFTGPLADAMYTDCDITVTDFAGNSNAAALEVNDFEIDTVPATIATVTTEDTDFDGSIDTATLVFTDEIDDSTVVLTDFDIEGTNPTAMTTGTADDDTILFTFGTQIAGTEAKTLNYNSDADDLAGNDIAPFSELSIDAAGPVLLSAITTSVTTIDVTFSEDLNGATVNSSGDEFAVTGFAVSDADETAPGVVTLTVATMPTDATPDVTYNLQDTLLDLAGNEAIDGKSATAVDGVAPVLTDVSISSNNAKDGTAWAKEGDTVTLAFTGSEELAADPVVVIAGESATVTDLGTNDWQATLVMDGDDPEGVITFTIGFSDVAVPTPNAGTQVTAVTDATEIYYDRTDPAVDAGDDQEVNATFTQTTASATDGGSDIDFVQWTDEGATGNITFDTDAEVNTDVTSNTDGVYSLRLTAEDEAGNSEFDAMQLIWDTTAPRLEFIVPAHNSTGVSTDAGTLSAYFRQLNHGANDENIVLLNGDLVFIEDTSGIDVQNGASVDLGDGNSRVLEVTYDPLTGGTTYCLTIMAGAVRDVAGNVTTEDIDSRCFTTELDTVVPFLISLMADPVDSDSADITAVTNEEALCRIAMTDSEFGSMSPFDSSEPDGLTHYVTIGGLPDQTSFTMFVRCQDAAGNEMTTSGVVTFTTLVNDTDAPPAPVISTGETTVNADNTVISGTADADTPSDGPRTITVYAGADAAGSLTLVTGQTSWSVVVPLAQNATTTFSAKSADSYGNESIASNTVDIGESDTIGAPDTTAPDAPVIDVSLDGITVDSDTYEIFGTVTADSDILTVFVECSCSVIGSVQVPAGETTWAVTVTLGQDTINEFNARVADASGNTSADSASVLIEEASEDSIAPTVIAEATNVTDTEADIEITVDESAICRVGPSDVAYGLLPTELSGGAADTAHLYELTGLNDGTVYDFFVRCADATGNISDAAQVEFTTDSNDTTGPSIQGIQATSIDYESVTIEWVTDESADSQVEYGTDSGYGNLTAVTDTPVSTDGVTSHSVTITGLDSSTTHHFRVISADAQGNTTTSDDNTFDTTFDDSTAILEVTGINAISTFAQDTDDYADGWSWTFEITVPTDEVEFAMKFSDFVSGANTIAAAGNIRYYTAQSTEAEDNTEAVTIAGANTYPGSITLDSDLDAGTAGRQIEVTVEMKVPAGSEGGSYSASYGINSDTI